MNKPLAFICSCIAGVGLLILGRSIYFTVVYGHGDPEAGNFHRCLYSSERDPVTRKIRRDWDTDWSVVSSTEGSPAAQVLDMWVVGIAFIIVGAGTYIVEWWSRDRQYRFWH